MKARYASSIFTLLVLWSVPAYGQTDRAAGKAATIDTWKIDSAHSELTFSLRHLGGLVNGRFHVWSGTVKTAADNWNDAAVHVAIRASSIDTDNKGRDKHLRSSDFFEVDKYPEITFQSTGIKRTGDSVSVAGTLTIKGVTKPVVLSGLFTPPASGQESHLSFRGTTIINRLDYGVSYNRVLEGGGSLLGDDVTIDIAVTAVRH